MPRPQSRAVPVTVISGFLGAGKTTVLNHILRADHGLRIAVMVNDFGELDIDSQTIVSVEEQVYSLANGCICCTVQNDLLEQVVGLMRRKQDAPDYILIETSGVSDPIRVVHTLQYPQLRGLVTVDGVICVVDSEQFGDLSADMARLAMDQLDAADIILINKTDLVSRPRLEALKQAWLYPGAKIFETSFGQVSVELLITIDSLHTSASPAAKSVDRKRTGDNPAPEGHAVRHPHDVAFDTWSWTGTGTFSLERLRAMLKALPAGVFRAKGFFDVDALPERRAALHLVGSRVDLTRGSAWHETETRQNQIVFIGASGSIDPALLERHLRACVVQDSDAG